MECCNHYSNADNSMRLLTACRSNNYSLVQKIIYANIPKRYHKSSLFLCQKQKTQYKVLNKLRGFINTCDEGGYSSLHYAAFHDNPEMLRLLLIYGASPLCIDNDNKTIIHIVCEHGNEECLNTIFGYVLLKAKQTNDFSTLEALLTSHDSAKGLTPLLITGMLSNQVGLRILERLLHYASEMPINNALRQKTELNMLTAKSKNGETILHIASRQNNPQMVTLALSSLSRIISGTRAPPSVASFINERNNKGSTALCVACDNKVSAENNDGYIVGTLCANGAKLDIYTDRGWYPIHRAALSGHFAAIKVLASLPQFDPNIATIRDPAPLYPLHLLAKNGSYQALEAVKFILEHGADKTLFKKDALYWTPLHYAAESAGEATHLIAEALLKKVLAITNNNAYKVFEFVQMKDDESLSPIMKASENGHDKFLLTLFSIIKKEYIPQLLNDKFSKNDYTALHFACQNGYMNVVKVLVENSANIYIKDKQGLTPEQTARRFHHDKISQYLKGIETAKEEAEKKKEEIKPRVPVEKAKLLEEKKTEEKEEKEEETTSSEHEEKQKPIEVPQVHKNKNKKRKNGNNGQIYNKTAIKQKIENAAGLGVPDEIIN